MKACGATLLVLLALFLFLEGGVVQVNAASPDRFLNYLLNNKWNNSNLPLSYRVPPGYWNTVPIEKFHNKTNYEAACGRVCTTTELDNYRYQTEKFLTTYGVNLYDAAVREMALALLDRAKEAIEYEQQYLVPGKTLQLANIRGNTPCNGISYFGQCKDDQSNGACGFCYGGNDGSKKGVTLDSKHAFFFRMIGDVWAFDGSIDARCPEKKMTWTWNDWRPVAGENGWANLIGPLQTAYIQAKKNANAVDDNGSALQLAVQIIDAFKVMQMANGAIAYAPYNTYDYENPALGGTASTENNVSILSGLKMLLRLLQEKENTQHKALISQLQDLITKILGYLKSSYSPELGFFRQGGTYSQDGTWRWNSDPTSQFAVDCQTWAISVLGAETVDGWFGAGTTLKIWQKTKELGGYSYDPATKKVVGLGFTYNQKEQVFSGEWSFGAINMLRIIATQLPSDAKQLLDDAETIRKGIEDKLTARENAINSDVVLYSNHRYYIPFGWYANPIPSTASIGWAVFTDLNWNPFQLGGAYAFQK